MFARLTLAGPACLMAGPAVLVAETQPGDPVRGAVLWTECSSCHEVGPEAVARVGPPLTSILGRTVGRYLGFEYSDAMLGEGAGGLVWSIEALDAYIADPQAFIPRTHMSYIGLPDANARADLIAYLAEGMPKTTEAFAISPEIFAIVGDPAYGAYLSSECVACHSDGAQGIPQIRNLPATDFVTMMHAYRSGNREHPAMQIIAARLTDEEIAALAAYFENAQ